MAEAEAEAPPRCFCPPRSSGVGPWAQVVCVSLSSPLEERRHICGRSLSDDSQVGE